MSLFLGYFVPWIYLSIRLPVPHCLSHCSYKISLNIELSDSFLFILLSEDGLLRPIQRPVLLHILFGKSLPVLSKK